MKSFCWLLKRELWENRSFAVVPAVIAGLALCFMLLGVAQSFDHPDAGAHIRDHFRLDDVTPEKRYLAMKLGMMTTAIPFNVVMLVLIAVYLLDSLYGERRDRSILFWKSLPVSDAAVVLSKLATAVLVAPMITLAAVAVAQLGVLTIASIGFLRLGLEGWGWMWNPLGWLSGWAALAYGYLLLMAVLLPYLAWLLLASVWARRAPLLWAAVPPLALVILEQLFLGTGRVRQWVFGHMGNLLPRTFNLPTIDLWNHVPGEQTETAIQPGLEFFVEPAVLVGLLIAGLFMATAIRLRRYRDED
jgi:ABC-2 type transport system permease protein